MKNLIVYFFIVVLMCRCNTPESESFLIPFKFKGKVNIIFDQVGGNPQLYENSQRIYKVPLNGILLTKFKEQNGFIDRKYFYVDSAGSRIPLMIFKYDYNKNGTIKWLVTDSNSVGIFEDGTAGVYGSSKFHFQAFKVSTLHFLDSINDDEFLEKVKYVLGDNFGADSLNIDSLKSAK